MFETIPICENNYLEVIDYFKSFKDEKNILFEERIINQHSAIFLGLKKPIINKIVKELFKTNQMNFITYSGNNYYEEIIIRGCLIAKIRDYDLLIKCLDKHVLTLESWASTDGFPKSNAIDKNKNRFREKIIVYINSDKEYIVRFGYVSMLKYYITDEYLDYVLDNCAKYKGESYFVMMSIAWVLSYCYVNNPQKTLDFVMKNITNEFIIKKFISKCKDSYRISVELKSKLCI